MKAAALSSPTARLLSYELRDVVRSRWALAYTAFFLLVTDAFFRFSGGGEQATEAFLMGGDYVVTVTTGSDCYYGIDLEDADGGFNWESLATRSEPGTSTTNLFAIPRGRYFIDVITGPSPDCPWTVRIVG